MIKFNVRENKGFLILEGTDTAIEESVSVAINLNSIELVFFGVYPEGQEYKNKAQKNEVLCFTIRGRISAIDFLPGCLTAEYNSKPDTTVYFWYGEAESVLEKYFFGY